MTWLRLGGIAALVAIALGLAAPAEAATFRSGTRVEVGPGEVVHDDMYLAGLQVEINGTVKGDVVVAGGSVTVRGRVEGDLIAAGGRLRVEAPVAHAARLAGATVTVAAPVGGDLLVAAGEVLTLPQAGVGGESHVRAGEARLEGHLGRGLEAMGGDIQLAGSVLGPTRLEAPRLAVTDGARVEGKLVVKTAQPNAVSPLARVQGGGGGQLIEPQSWGAAFWRWLLRLAMALAAGLALLWLLRESADSAASCAAEKPWLRVLAGLGVLLGAPFVAIMAMLTVIGLPLGLLGLAGYAATLYVSQLVVAWMAGRMLLGRFFDLERGWKPAAAFTLGLVGLWALKEVPLAGAYVTMVAVMWGLGAIATMAFRGFRRRHPVGADEVT